MIVRDGQERLRLILSGNMTSIARLLATASSHSSSRQSTPFVLINVWKTTPNPNPRALLYKLTQPYVYRSSSYFRQIRLHPLNCGLHFNQCTCQRIKKLLKRALDPRSLFASLLRRGAPVCSPSRRRGHVDSSPEFRFFGVLLTTHLSIFETPSCLHVSSIQLEENR